MLAKYLRFLVRDQSFTLFSIVFIIAYWVQAGGMPFVSIRYPLVVTAVAGVFILWNIALSVIRFRQRLRAEQQGEAEEWDLTFDLTPKKWGVIAITLLYIALIPVLGYVVTICLYIPALCLFLGIRKPGNIVLYTAVMVGLMYGIFRLWLYINLPTGLLI